MLCYSDGTVRRHQTREGNLTAKQSDLDNDLHSDLHNVLTTSAGVATRGAPVMLRPIIDAK